MNKINYRATLLINPYSCSLFVLTNTSVLHIIILFLIVISTINFSISDVIFENFVVGLYRLLIYLGSQLYTQRNIKNIFSYLYRIKIYVL